MSATAATAHLPLSAAQQAMWAAHRLAPDSSAYNIVMPLRVRGRLDPAAMGRAVTAVGARQELLRSVFVERDGGPWRIVFDRPPVGLEQRDLTGCTEEELYTAAAEEGARPFRLDAATFRVVLLRRSDTDWAVVTSAHHIVSDFTSRWLLVRDVLEAYRAEALGVAPTWPGITGSWGAHVAEEIRYLDSPSGRRAGGHWREVAGSAPPAELPLDRPRPAVRGYRGGTVVDRLPEESVRLLAGAAKQCGVTPFAFLLAVFQALTHRWTGQREFLLGVPASGRMGKDLRHLVGCFLNTVPVRADFPAGLTFRQAAAGAGREVMSGMLNVRHPCTRLPGGASLFHAALFLVQMDRMEPPVPGVAPGEPEGPALDCGDVRVSLIDVPQQEGQLDLLLRLEQSPDGITAVFSYDAEVLDRETVERFAEGYRRMLAAAVTDPGTAVTQVPLTGTDELAGLLALATGDAGDTDY